MRMIEYNIEERFNGKIIKTVLKSKGYSHALLTSLKNGCLLLNGQPANRGTRVRTGDVLTVYFKDDASAEPNERLYAGIAYDDDDVVVIDKPRYMPVHPSKGHKRDTLANLFAAKYPGAMFRSINRLDKNTSGLIIIAKNKLAASRLMSDDKFRMEKVYYAVTDKGFAEEYPPEGEIIAPIGREYEGYVRRIVRTDGLYAHTRYRIMTTTEKVCLAEVRILTGRTHQIRVHFSYLGHPLLGDSLYGGSTEYIGRQALHCGRLSFIHPMKNERIELYSPLPYDISRLFQDDLERYIDDIVPDTVEEDSEDDSSGDIL